MFISNAWAQAAQTPGTQDIVGSILPLILIFVVFYFLLIRPQQKRMKEHQQMIAGLRRGDRVVTSGGIVGVIARVVSEDRLQVEVAPEVSIEVLRSSISQILSKPTAANDAGNEATPAAKPATKKAPAKKAPAAKSKKPQA
jgi:preprotein translocase subunit YajC